MNFLTPVRVRRVHLRVTVVTVALVTNSILVLPSPLRAQQRYPGEQWEQARSAESLGWSSKRLVAAREYADSIGSAAVMVVVDGLVLADWGETDRRFRAHSMRKSLLTSLYGIYVKNGQIDLDTTLDELGIAAEEGLTRVEGQATVRNLLQGRSGVYVPALYLSGSLDLPPRGSHEPGTYFHYANFDFNTLGTIFERQTGKRIFEEFKRQIAEPLQMQDFRVEDGLYWYGNHEDNVNTRLFAYPFRITARDLARFGLLFLRDGRWRDRQVIPEEWIKQVFTPYSDFAELTGYGYTNWKIDLEGKTLPNGYRLPGRAYWASGVNVHRVYVVPFADLVFVHRINSDLPGRRPSSEQVERLLGLILAARVADVGQALRMAAAEGDVEAVQGLLEGGANVDEKDVQGLTALHHASRRGHTAVVRALLGRGADVNARSDLGQTPLMAPAWSGNTATVHALIAAGAVVDAKDEFMGWTALMSAATRGHSGVVRDLLAVGADLNARAMYLGESSLVLAAAAGAVETVRVLLDAGASVDEACTGGTTPLMIAEALGHLEVADVLVRGGAAREAALLPLRAYLPPGLVAAAGAGNIWMPPAAYALLSRGVAVSATGESALLFAAMRGDTERVRALLIGGGDVDVRHEDGWTGLLLAALNGHDGTVRALLDAAAQVDVREKRLNQTALIWAAQAGHAGIVEMLLNAGADANLRDRFGGTALTRAAAAGRGSIVTALIDAGADLGVVENDGDTALLEAVQNGHGDVVQALLDLGANLDARGEGGRTALIYAAVSGKEEIVRMLATAGADVDAEDDFGTTALEAATVLGRDEVVRLLEK